ncbi:MAG TPA: response regulator [Cyclobacteriaceae bacterium]|nr:response regulator [Cyclobacteriaceae bacterium]
MKTCYLIEDDIDDQDIFRMSLNEIDETIKCDVANNGYDALQRLNAETGYTPDYIFMDVNMPKMNGIDCLKQLKKLSRLNDTQIIMLSTSQEPRIINLCKQLGANDFLVKPPSLDSLTLMLSKIIKP